MLMKVSSVNFNFDRRTKKLCCAAFIDRKVDHRMYNSFYLNILIVVNTLQLVYNFGDCVYKCYIVFKYSVCKMLEERSFSL